MVVVQNSVKFMGGEIFTHLLEPILNRALNEYQHEFVLKSPFRGQDTSASFVFDFRNT